MANPLYNSFGNRPTAPSNPVEMIINQAREMRRTFKGDPRQAVQNLLNSGQMTQQQFNQYSQIANQILSIMPK